MPHRRRKNDGEEQSMPGRRRASLRRGLLDGAAAATMSLLAGCMVGPDFHHPATPDAADYTPEPLPATAAADVHGGAAQRFVRDLDIPGQWWALFHSPELNALVEQALQANPSLDAAKAALREAQENVYAGQGALYPT